MAEHSRIDDLRRRVLKDPASIAFAQLAEECRRAGAYQEAVQTCRAGLAIHPGYLSARVTLGRALLELGELAEAHAELSRVLESAPENLAAIRGLAEIYHRRGELPQALVQYRAALSLARHDPDLEQTIADLARQVEPSRPPETDGLTLQHMQHELLRHAPPNAHQRPQSDVPPVISLSAVDVDANAGSAATAAPAPALSPQTVPSAGSPEPSAISAVDPLDDRATRTVEALEQWLDAIHVARAGRSS
jgi:tetratricopeptide (TPR) repeat protein